MADKEIKAKDNAVEKAEKKAPKKAKKDKPSFFSKIAAWFRSCKAEMKKIVWTGWPTVRSNTLMVLVTIIVISAVIGLVDVLFSQSIVILGILI